MIKKVIKRDGRVVPFDPEKITFAVLRAAVAVGGRDRRTAEHITNEVVKLLERRQAEDRIDNQYPTVEEVQDCVEKVLIEEGHARTAKAYIVYRYEHALKRQGKESLTYSSENIPYRKLWETLDWAVDHDCYSLSQIRAFVDNGEFGRLVGLSEAFYRSEVEAAIGAIEERLNDLRVVIVSGPSSSGKTTTTIKVSEALERKGRRLVPIAVDNYFYDLETHPTDTHGDYDFETPQALDLELFNEHLEALLDGRTVDIPYYNFKSGNREGVSNTLTLEENDIILIDSLHGLYEPMTESVPSSRKFKLYIETLAQLKDDDRRYIRWTDVRMLRRMVRDMQFRNYNPYQTLLHWYLVRRSELRYIVSRLRQADTIVNSFMPCELPLLKRRVGARFDEFVDRLKGDPDRRDAYERAVRVRTLLESVPDVDGEDEVPGDSLLREFIGGSTYEY
jgi:uridine kinase